MPRKRTVTSVKNSADQLWSLIVRARAGNRCEHCPRTADYAQIHAHHVVGRQNHRLRYEPRNGVSLCAGCHRWVHDDPIAFTHWFEGDRTGDAAFLGLEKAKGLLKRTLSDYIDLEAELKTELANWTEEAAA